MFSVFEMRRPVEDRPSLLRPHASPKKTHKKSCHGMHELIHDKGLKLQKEGSGTILQ
jgi:hypothetical protein